ncbi:MAG: glucokinase [Candidatus Dormibacteraeota bacterium]|nr:glucokinase [Candidatus Dormibacteraeota bacterium]
MKPKFGEEGRLLLAGDVGGTKTDLAVVSVSGGPRETLAKRRYPSADYSGLAEISRAFLNEVGLKVDGACFDVAGPVLEGHAHLTNLTWQIDETSLADALGVDRTWLLNDLVAIASAIPILRPDDLYQIKEGEAVPGGAIAVLAPGTGLGEAYLVATELGYRAQASEGGHAAFAPTTELELDLLREMWKDFEHVSFERVASGVGIPNLYEFLRDHRGIPESPRLASELLQTEDRTRPILQAALDPSVDDPLADATMDLFLHILGTEAANISLKFLATGGLYMAGGIAQVLRERLRMPVFLDAFVKAGRFTKMLEQVPVYVIMGEVALLGAASEGLRLFTPSAGSSAESGTSSQMQ